MKIVGRLRDLRRTRCGDAAALGAIALFFILFFPHAISGRRFIIAGDAFYYSYPLRTIGWEMIRNGQLPLWTPLVLSGYPLLSMPQLAFGYPLTWIHLFLPGQWAEQIYVLAPFLLSPVFTYAYARETGRSRLAALLAGLCFGYGGMMCGGIANSGMLTNSMMWLPLLLIPIDRVRRRGSFAGCLVAATAAYSMSVLNGHGQSFVYAGIVAAAYGLFLSLFPLRADAAGDDAGAEASTETLGRGPGFGRWRPLAVALGGMTLAACVAAFQILETMRAARRSIRSALTYESLGEGSFTFLHATKSLFAPLYHYIDTTPYVPPLALLLAVIAGWSYCRVRWGRERTGACGDARVCFWLVAAGVAWILMLGSFTPFHHLVFRVPFLNLFRVPSRHTFEWTFAIAVLAAYGWDAVVAKVSSLHRAPSASGTRRRTLTLGLLALMAVAVGALWWRAIIQPPTPVSSYYTGLAESNYLLWKAAFVVLTLATLWQLWRLPATRWRAASLAFVVMLVCFVEPSARTLRQWSLEESLSPGRFAAVSNITRRLQKYPPEQNRVYTRIGLFVEEFSLTPQLEGPNLTALHGLHNVAGMEPLIFARYSRALGGIGPDSVSPRAGYAPNQTLFQTQSHVLDILNTTFAVSYINLSPYPVALMSKDGISFLSVDTNLDLSPGQSLMLGGTTATADTLVLVSSLANSAGEIQGHASGQVRVYTTDGRVIERPLRAGVDSAEWAHERSDVRGAVQHALAPVFDSRPGDEANSFPAYRYWTRIPLGERASVNKVEVVNGSERAVIGLSKASLYDSATAVSKPLGALPSESWKTFHEEGDAVVLQNGRALPRAWLVTEAKAVDGEEALRLIRGEADRSFDPRRTALMEVKPDELPALTGEELPPGSAARIVEYQPARLSIETNAPTQTVLVVSEIIYPGWEATIDGAPAMIHTTDFILRGVVVPAGAHRVEMRYRAPAARNGAIISAVTLVGLCGLTIYERRMRRRTAKT